VKNENVFENNKENQIKNERKKTPRNKWFSRVQRHSLAADRSDRIRGPRIRICSTMKACSAGKYTRAPLSHVSLCEPSGICTIWCAGWGNCAAPAGNSGSAALDESRVKQQGGSVLRRGITKQNQYKQRVRQENKKSTRRTAGRECLGRANLGSSEQLIHLAARYNFVLPTRQKENWHGAAPLEALARRPKDLEDEMLDGANERKELVGHL
jgi:hypothetical protein